MRVILLSPILWLALAAALPAAETYEATGADAVRYAATQTPDALVLRIAGAGIDQPEQAVFVALGLDRSAGSLIVPFAKGFEGSTVFLPFKADLLLTAKMKPGGADLFLRRWQKTMWGERQAARGEFSLERAPALLTITIPNRLVGGARRIEMAVYLKDLQANDGWGRLYGALDPRVLAGTDDKALRRYLVIERQGSDGTKFTWETRGGTDLAKVRIYQMLPRLFGNTNETRKPNGFLEDNGSGKFSDLNETSLAALKDMGFTHIWVTGVLQQATATDYAAVGEPADDPDLLKGLAGSPYAIKDYFDVSPDYAEDPAKRLEEFKAMVARVHQAGMKVIIDFVPNHVARSYASTVKPDLTFGNKDNRRKFFSPENNFFWLTPESKATGKGPPLRLPTVDKEGKIISPTSRVARAPSDGLFEGEMDAGRVTGNNLVSWEPDKGSWYETVKLNYGFDFTDPDKATRAYPHGAKSGLAVPDTWKKMDQVIAYWQGLGVDGFRVDMAHMVPPEFWHWMIGRARDRSPEVFFVAEAYNTDPAKVPGGDPLVAEVGDSNVMYDLLNAGFDAVYDDDTYDMLKGIYDGQAWANDLDYAINRSFLFDNSLRYAENHDEVRLAGQGHWADLGPAVGRPVTALLFGLSRGPVMLYHGQEVGEPASGAEGFGGDDARTSIFDYWSMPEFAKWVNEGKFDGGRLSPEQQSLRAFYGRLTKLVDEPAFRDGGFFPLNAWNVMNPAYGRLKDEQASGHWLYSYLRHSEATGQNFLVVVNLHPTHTFRDVRVILPRKALRLLGYDTIAGSKTIGLTFTERLSEQPPEPFRVPAAEAENPGVPLPELPPLTPLFFEITPPAAPVP